MFVFPLTWIMRKVVKLDLCPGKHVWADGNSYLLKWINPVWRTGMSLLTGIAEIPNIVRLPLQAAQSKTSPDWLISHLEPLKASCTRLAFLPQDKFWGARKISYIIRYNSGPINLLWDEHCKYANRGNKKPKSWKEYT